MMDDERHCEFEGCDELAPVRIQEVCICTHHIQWAMDLAFKPVKEAMKVIEENDHEKIEKM